MTPLVVAAKFHGKDGGSRYLGLLKLRGVLAPAQLQEWWKKKPVCKAFLGLPVQPAPPLPWAVVLPTVNAPLSSVSDTDFSKILWRPCVPHACGLKVLLPSQGCWLKKSHKILGRNSSTWQHGRLAPITFCFSVHWLQLPSDQLL